MSEGVGCKAMSANRFSTEARFSRDEVVGFPE